VGGPRVPRNAVQTSNTTCLRLMLLARGPSMAPRRVRGRPSPVKGASRRCAIAARPLTGEPLRPLRAGSRAGQGPARKGARRHRRRSRGHDHGFGASTGESAPGTRPTADHEGRTPSVIADPAHPQSSESMLPDRGARRPEFRHHDPQYRASMVSATATCSRYPQVTAAIKGSWSQSEIN
jgi:hypothetical protein